MNLFEDELDDQKEDTYIKFLKERGYIIIPPKELDFTSVKSASAMVDYFYALLQYHNKDRRIHYSKALEIDRRKANSFIKSRMAAGSGNRQRAIKECVEIIKCVIENESLFLLTEPIHSFDCFGQDHMQWVTKKAISLINNENARVKRNDLIQFMDRLAIDQEKESLETFYDNIEELKDILGGLRDAEEEKKD